MHLKVEEFENLKFGGLNGSWKYKPRGNFLYDQWEVNDMLGEFPSVDIFVAHNSPRGIHDKDDLVHEGFEALTKYIEIHQPRLLIHGHQHVNQETTIGKTKVLGVFGSKIIEL